MREHPDHFISGGKKAALPAELFRGEAGDLRIERYGPKNLVKREILLSEKADPVGGNGRDSTPSGEGIRAGHPIPRGNLDEEVLYPLFPQGFEEPLVIGDDDQTIPPRLEGADEVELLIAMAVGDEAAEVFVSLEIFGQENGPIGFVEELAPQNGLDSGITRLLDEEDSAIEAVRVGQGQPLHVMRPGGPAKLLDGRESPTPGIVGMDVQMDVVHSSVSRRMICRKDTVEITVSQMTGVVRIFRGNTPDKEELRLWSKLLLATRTKPDNRKLELAPTNGQVS